MGMKEIRKVLDNISVEEVKVGAEEAVTLMNTSESEVERKAAKQTYVALARFGSHLQEEHEVKPRINDDSSEQLKSAIQQSGIAFFGPMFQDRGYSTPLHDRTKIFEEMSRRGYSVKPLHHLTDTQLDMLFTKTLESGLLSSPNILQPQA